MVGLVEFTKPPMTLLIQQANMNVAIRIVAFAAMVTMVSALCEVSAAVSLRF
jgi:hypothetical protein